jgi:hypothetical protein
VIVWRKSYLCSSGTYERERERERVDNSHELICEFGVSLSSRDVGQVLLHPIGGGQLEGGGMVGVGLSS